MRDFKLDETGDLLIKNGDFVIDNDATIQHQKDILFLEKGELKESVLVGVGIRSYVLDDADGDKLLHEIQEQVERDGMRVETLTIDENYNVELNAEYKRDERR